MGAVTTERTPVSGCRVQPLGVMRYVPVASPVIHQAVSARWLHCAGGGRSAVAGVESRRRAAGHAGTQGLSTGHQTAAAFRSDRRGLRRRGHVRDWVGECSRTASPRRTWPTARSYGFPMCISMCRCSGSAGSWIARWSRASLTPCGLPLLAYVRNENDLINFRRGPDSPSASMTRPIGVLAAVRRSATLVTCCAPPQHGGVKHAGRLTPCRDGRSCTCPRHGCFIQQLHWLSPHYRPRARRILCGGASGSVDGASPGVYVTGTHA